jgi:hypothetical protein
MRSTVHRSPIFIVACLSCSPRLIETTAANTTGDSESTSGSVGSSTEMLPTSTTMSNTGQDGATSVEDEEASGTDNCGPSKPDMGDGPFSCDVWEQSCSECEKCTPYFYDGKIFSGLKCVPVGPLIRGVGEACIIGGKFGDGIDNCEKGALCWNLDGGSTGTCVALCTGTAQTPGCKNPQELCWISGEAIVPLCFHECNPLVHGSCPQMKQVCVPLPSPAGFVCIDGAPDNGGGKYDACDSINSCSDGNACLAWGNVDDCDAQSSGCCLPFCDVSLDSDPRCDADNNEMCVPWFDPIDVPDGYKDVGVCVAP